jgi:hypothetical protein
MYFFVMPRVNLIVILMTYVRYLCSINCPTVICLPSMCNLSYGDTPLVNCGPHPISFTLLYRFTFTRTVYFLAYYYPITTRYAESFVYSKLVRLTTSSSVGSKVLGCVVCRFHVVAGENLHTGSSCIWRPCPKCHKASKHHLLKFGSFSYWFD